MALLVRKINRAKWKQNDILDGAQPSGDAVTHCLKTLNNTISVWTIDRIEDIANAVIAIAASLQRVETFDVVVLDEDELSENGIEMERTPGVTACTSMVKAHVDLCNVDYAKLGVIAQAIVRSFQAGSVVRFTRGNLLELLRKAVNGGQITSAELQEGVQRAL